MTDEERELMAALVGCVTTLMAVSPLFSGSQIQAIEDAADAAGIGICVPCVEPNAAETLV